MFTIGNEELREKSGLGDFILCDKCGERHRVEHGTERLANGTEIPDKLLAFYRCGNKSYLTGIRGKDIR